MAIAGVGVLQAAGLQIPTDMSVIGFDGNEIGAYLHPALTTVATDPYRWGAEAVLALLDLVRTGEAVDRHLPPAELLLRGSTCPPPLPNPGELS